jgi:glutaredoxin
MKINYFDKLKKIFDTHNNKYIIFGTNYCIYCQESKKLLKKNKINFIFIDIHQNPKLFFNLIKEFCKKNKSYQFDQNHKTIPVIFYNKNFIGGYTDLKKII